MKTAGLSLEQAPPIELPLGLFLAAPLFLIAAGLLLAAQPEVLLASRWTPAALAATHLIAVGFLGQVMCGALLQILPVLAGAPVPAVRVVGTLVPPLLSGGAGLLAWGFLGAGAEVLMWGGLLSATGFLVFLGPAAHALVRAPAVGLPDTVWALRLAGSALAVTVALGLVLVAALLGGVRLGDFPAWVDTHLAWGLLGWVGLLVLGVAYQLVPMFHLTPEYPAALRRWLAPMVAGALLLGTVLTGSGAAEVAAVVFLAGALGLAVFALVTLGLLHRRERARLDATLLHWVAAMLCLAGSALAAAVGAPGLAIGVLGLLGVGVGLTAGMLLKIVPFLGWFHLQHRQIALRRFDLRLPHMRALLPETWARVQLATHLIALAALLLALAEPRIGWIAGVLLGLSALTLEVLLVVAALRYRRFAGRLAPAG
ncbi:MAG: hypothetical protein MUC77_20315 [Chromatiaceae bacterium]|nr:hypothetical protein [Chromatiaceae bacterium]